MLKTQTSRSVNSKEVKLLWSSKNYFTRLLIHKIFLTYSLLKASVHLCDTVMLRGLLQYHDRASQIIVYSGLHLLWSYLTIFNHRIEWIHKLDSALAMGESYLRQLGLKELTLQQKYLSRDVDINKIGFCISNYPNRTVITTFPGQFWNLFTL